MDKSRTVTFSYFILRRFFLGEAGARSEFSDTLPFVDGFANCCFPFWPASARRAPERPRACSEKLTIFFRARGYCGQHNAPTLKLSILSDTQSEVKNTESDTK